MAFISPVPPHIEIYTADLIIKSNVYKDSVQLMEDKDMTEDTVVSQRDASLKR